MEESGWKNVHGDVFRPPQYPMILSSLLGSGIQLFCVVLIVICECFCSADSLQKSKSCCDFRASCRPPCVTTGSRYFLTFCDFSTLCVCCSRGHAGNVVSVQPWSPDDHFLLPLHVHGVGFPAAPLTWSRRPVGGPPVDAALCLPAGCLAATSLDACTAL